MESAMQRYLTYKAALLEPSTIDSQTALMAATGSWLVRLVTGTEAIILDELIKRKTHLRRQMYQMYHSPIWE